MSDFVSSWLKQWIRICVTHAVLAVQVASYNLMSVIDAKKECLFCDLVF